MTFFFAFVQPSSQSINQRYLDGFPLGAEDPRWFKLHGSSQGRRLREDASPNELERDAGPALLVRGHLQ